MYKPVEVTGTPRLRRQHSGSELLGKDPLYALHCGTSEAANIDDQVYRFSCQRQIGDLPLMSAMNPPTFLSARGTTTRLRSATYRHRRSIVIAQRGDTAKPAGIKDNG